MHKNYFLSLYEVSIRFLANLPQLGQICCKNTFVESEYHISLNFATNVPNMLLNYLVGSKNQISLNFATIWPNMLQNYLCRW